MRSAFAAVLGLMLMGVLAAVGVDTGGMNLETRTESESAAADGRADEADEQTDGTLIVQTPGDQGVDALSAESGAVDDDTVDAVDDPDDQSEDEDAQTSLGTAESATTSGRTTESSQDRSATSSSTQPDDSGTTASTTTGSTGSTRSGASPTTGSSTRGSTSTTQGTTATQDTSTQGTSTQGTTGTTEQTSTTQQTTTSEQTTTTQRTTTTAAPSGSGPIHGVGRASQPSGAVLHVRKGAASGGNGSESRPFNTINDGIRAVRAGQTLMVHGGEYRERIIPASSLPDGTASQPILVTNAPGERVVVKGYVRLTGLTHFTLDGINVTWDSSLSAGEEHMVLLKGGSNWEWRNSEFWGARAASAVLVGDSPRNWALRGNYIHDTHPTNGTNQDHLIYCSCGSGGGVIERNLLVGSPNGRAIKIGTTSSSNPRIENLKVRYNTMVDNGGPSNIQVSFKVANITIERNLLVSPQSGKHNITAWRLEGASNIAVGNNMGWDSEGVVESHSAIRDTGGNRMQDPRLNSRYQPQDSAARGYGHLAP